MSFESDLLIVGVRWPPETFIQRKVLSLAKAGVKVAVAASVSRHEAKRFSLPGVPLIRLPHHRDSVIIRSAQLIGNVIVLLASSRGRKTLGILWRDAKRYSLRARLNRLLSTTRLARLNPKIVHFEWNSAAIDYGVLSEIWNCPQVVSCRGSQVNIRPYLLNSEAFVQGLRQSFERATAVHCVSEAIRQEAVNFGLDPAKACVIRPAVDPEFFYAAPKEHARKAGFLVVTTGSLIWRKGYEYALLAIRRLVDRGVDVHFEIIGDGPERERVLYTIDDLDLKGRVQLVGRLAPEQVRVHLQRADVFLLSSLSEGISNAVLEAMACGLPVVTTDCGGMREAVTDGVEGFVVPVRDPDCLAAALFRLAQHPHLRETMGQAARERILKEFTLKQQAEKFLHLYQNLLTQ